MMYFCCDKLRRNAVEADLNLNGIHYLEVLDDPHLPDDERQRTLFVHFLTPLNAGQLTKDNVFIEGGERITGIKVKKATIGGDGVLTVEVDQAGDFSIYTLYLVKGAANAQPPAGIDPMFSSVDFSFKVECPSPFDCEPSRICPSDPRVEPDIDYLAKDYASFRRVMLDRMAATLPTWRERHAADQGMMLVELLAHVGDHLSYQQDAIATEAYLGTARRRISVRRHARLVDYFMHDGCNARTWVQVFANGTNVSLNREITVHGKPTTTKLLTRFKDVGGAIQPGSKEHGNAMEQRPAVFELMEDAQLFGAHNKMTFYTWSDQECCLPRGATTAYLKDDEQDRLHLRVGDVLVFEEVSGPRTGAQGDADPLHRHAVRLTQVEPEATLENDGVTRTPNALIIDPLTDQGYVKIQWDRKDALPFPLCLSTVTHDKQYLSDVSVARGNIVLADHGMTIDDESLGKVAEAEVFLPPSSDTACERSSVTPLFPRFRPRLTNRPLTQAPQYDTDENDTAKYNRAIPAVDALRCVMRDVGPEITLQSVLKQDTKVWKPRRDLINSDETDRHFVVEIERDDVAQLRFGDDRYGERPEAQTEFIARYRVGNGTAGNIAADSLAHIITNQTGIDGVRNMVAAQGGAEAESMEDARQRAPVAFRRQERAVTPDDYAEVTERQADVQKAAATFRWTGSWHTVFLTADRVEGLGVDPSFESRTRAHVERFRMAGHDLEVDAPRYVPLNIGVFVCVKPDYFRSDVQRALLDVFSNRTLADGRRGLFHPDNWTFGQTVYLSPLYEAAQAVAGVESVHIKTFEKMYAPDPGPLKTGKLELARLEIARLDNDRNFSERGVFHLELGGGK